VDDSQLKADNDELRQQIEGYRQRELAELREQLVVAKDEAAHYRSEASRNAEVGRQIHAEMQATNETLRVRIQALEAIPNARVAPSQ